MDDFRKLLDNNIYNEFGYMFKHKGASSHEFIKRALENFKNDDEMLILNTLSELCSELSMANDNLADDANCPTLIKELIVLLDKYIMLPDVGITALNCLNYLLDINPRYTSVITKWNGISKIVKMTQNFEYFECAETVIKSIEKMSYENPYIMIENNAFSSLLNLIEFCDLSLRKIALKACVNMTNCINNQEFIIKFIMPSIPNLSNLARFSGDTEMEKVILDLSVQCIYNIINAIKNYNLNNNMKSFYKVISEHGILENLYDIFLRYLKIEKESVYDDEILLKRKSSFNLGNQNSSVATSSNSNAFINLETFKNIIKIFEYFCTLNPDITNGILNMNILNVIYYILVKELGLIGNSIIKKRISQEPLQNDLKISLNGVSNSEKAKVESNSHGYFVDIFNLLISLFPNKNSKGTSDRLLAEENKKFFIYFSEKILCLIINNIVNIPSSNSMVQIFKLLEMYIQSSPIECIFTYVDPVKFSNIANKMLDYKDSSYILQVFSVVEIIMNKVPHHFIVPFIREGVIDNVKNLITIEDNIIYVPTESQTFLRDLPNYSDQLNNFMNFKEDEFIDESELLNQESDYIAKSKFENVKVLKKIKQKEVKENKIEIINNRNLENLNEGNLDAGKELEKGNIIINNQDVTSYSNEEDIKNAFFLSNNSSEYGDDSSLSPLNNFIFSTNNQDSNDAQSIKIETTTNTSNNVFSKENQNSFKDSDKFKISNLKDNKFKDNEINSENTNAISQNNLNKADNNLKRTQLVNSFNNENIIVKAKSFKKSINVGILSFIHSKAQEITDIFFNENNIDDLLKKADVQTNPRQIMKKLCKMRDMLKNPDNVDTKIILENIVESLFGNDTHTPTFYEIEKSEVILYLSKFFDENFIINLQNTEEGEIKTISKVSNKYNFDIIKKLQGIIETMNSNLDNIKAFLHSLQNCITSMNCFKLYIYDIANLRNNSSGSFFANLRNKSQKMRVKFSYSTQEDEKINNILNFTTLNKIFDLTNKLENLDNNEVLKIVNESFGNSKLISNIEELKILKNIHSFFMNLKGYPINVDLNENVQVIKDYFIKLKCTKNDGAGIMPNPNQIDFYEDLLSHITNRKNSEEDINLTEKLLQKIMERKKSIETNVLKKPESNEEGNIPLSGNSSNEIIQSNTVNQDNNPEIVIEAKHFEEKFGFIFFAVIQEEIFIVDENINMIDFVRELKNKIKKSDYNNFSNDIQLQFKIYLKNESSPFETVHSSENLFKSIEENINTAWNFSNLSNDLNVMEKIKYFNLFRQNSTRQPQIKQKKSNDEKIIILESLDISTYNLEENLEKILFEKYYFENIVNNPGLYSIKRAAPFIYLISLFELAINHFKNIFYVETKDDDFGLKAESREMLSSEVLQNLKVTSLLFKQIKDPYAVSNLSIPSWCKELIYNFTYLSGFNSRYLLFKITSFDIKRAISNLYIYLKNFLGENVVDDKNLSTFKRHKFKVDRGKILNDATILMRDYSNFSGFIEYEYCDETGTGLGPTLEFYSLCFKEITSMKKLWYKTTNNTLFPAPILNSDDSKERENLFMLLGFLVARALFDDRLIDLPLNALFWDLVLDRAISYDKIGLIDKDLNKAFKDFANLLKEKENLQKKNNNISSEELNSLILYNGIKIDEIGLTFNLPGYNDYELKPRGTDISISINNLEKYLALVFDKIVLSGIGQLVKAFKIGFNKVFKIESLKCFTNYELEEIICGCDYDNWDYENLIENIIPSHGYEKNSLMYQGLIQIMLGMNSLERKSFLQFVTGSPRLPLGGFKNLSPKLTIVLKTMIHEKDDPNNFLPTCMTCQKNLKIPNYSNVNILKERLQLAMNEGNNAFHLS